MTSNDRQERINLYRTALQGYRDALVKVSRLRVTSPSNGEAESLARMLEHTRQAMISLNRELHNLEQPHLHFSGKTGYVQFETDQWTVFIKRARQMPERNQGGADRTDKVLGVFQVERPEYVIALINEPAMIELYQLADIDDVIGHFAPEYDPFETHWYIERHVSDKSRAEVSADYEKAEQKRNQHD